VDAVAGARFLRRASFYAIAATVAIATLIAIILATPALAVSDQGFVGFLAVSKTGADIRVAADGAFIPHDFFDRLGTGIATMQDRISAAEALDGRDEFLIENNQQDDEGFHMRMLVY